MAIVSPINKTAFKTPSILKELKTINVVTMQLHRERKKRYELQRKFDTLQDRFGERAQFDARETAQETKSPIAKSFSKYVKSQATGLGQMLFGIMQAFLGYKVLEWVANPANLSKVQSIVKGLSGIFKFIDWFVTGSINNLLSGLHSLLFGGTILERIFGFFSAIVGFFGIRYFLNPLKIVKDLKFIIKNGDKIGEIFKAFKNSGIKEGAEKILQILPKTASIFRRGLAKGFVRGILKIFGKGGLRFLTKAVAPAVGGLVKLVGGPIKAIAKKTVAGIPIVGPLFDLGINLILGDPLDKAIIKAAGSTLGMGLGGVVGSVFPGPGTIVGGVLGGIVGDWAAGTLYDWMKGAFSKKETPQLAAGGIVTRPTQAIVGEAGPEAVVPLPQLFGGDIFSEPISMMGAGMIGGMNAFISSMGPAGIMIRPYANQLLMPYAREFGMENYVFSSDIGRKSMGINLPTKGEDNKKDKDLEKIIGKGSPKLLTDKDTNPRARYNSGNSMIALLGDIYNSLVNLNFTRGTGAGGGGGGGNGGAGAGGGMLPGDAPPEVKAMLDAISGGEGSWDSVNPSTTVPGLSNMTIADARKAAMQKGYSLGGSGAMGKWQQMPEFILERARAAGLNPDKDKFNQENQTKIARMLMAGVYPGGEAQLVKDVQVNPLTAASKLRGTWPSLPGGSQENTSSKEFLARFNSNISKYQKMQTGGLVFDPKKYQEGAKSSRYIPVGTGNDAKSYTISYVRKGSSGTYIIKGISKKVSGNLFTGDNLTSVQISSDEGKRVLNSANVHEYFRTVPNGGLARNLKLKLEPDQQSDIFWAYNQSYQTHYAEWKKQNVSDEVARQNAARAAMEFAVARKGASWTPGSKNGLDSSLSSTTATSTTTDGATTPTETVDWTGIAKSLGDLFTEFQGSPKTNGDALSNNSMDMIQSMKQQPFMTDTYIMQPANTTVVNYQLIAPISSVDFNVAAFSNLDTPSLAKRNL